MTTDNVGDGQLGFVVWRRNSAKWEVLDSFTPSEYDRAWNTAAELRDNEADYDGPADLAYRFGVSPVME